MPCYPRAARKNGIQGTVRLRFCVGEGGQPRDAQVVEESGQTLLDEAALHCVLERAAPYPAIRDCLTVPVRFRMAP